MLIGVRPRFLQGARDHGRLRQASILVDYGLRELLGRVVWENEKETNSKFCCTILRSRRAAI